MPTFPKVLFALAAELFKHLRSSLLSHSVIEKSAAQGKRAKLHSELAAAAAQWALPFFLATNFQHIVNLLDVVPRL